MSEKKRKGSLKSKLLWFIVLIGLFALIRQSFMILLVGMLPTLVVKFIDNGSDGMWFKTVFCFNLAGVYPYVMEAVIIHGNSTKAVQAQMADSMMWLFAYGAASCGYLAMWFFPTATEFVMRVTNKRRIEHHRKKLRRLYEEWNVGGSEVELL